MSSDEEGGKHYKKAPKTAYDVQRSKLEKLMKNPEKPVPIPEARSEKDPNKAPEFVYNVMGSSAGAGSGEFHVYRQVRRKEFARQKQMNEMKTQEELNEAFHAKLEENERMAEERTAKKRAKRQKKKQKMKKVKKSDKEVDKEQPSSTEEDEEVENDGKEQEESEKVSEKGEAN